MQQQLVEREATIEVPKGTGIEGFLRTVREILKQPLVQEIRLTAKGQVAYTRLVRENDPFTPVAIDFVSLMPHTIIRNGEVMELEVPQENAAVAISKLFSRVTFDRLYPVAFVGGNSSAVWEWHLRTTGVDLPRTNELYGLPFHFDSAFEDSMLFLCTSPARSGALVDVERTYKILMPSRGGK